MRHLPPDGCLYGELANDFQKRGSLSRVPGEGRKNRSGVVYVMRMPKLCAISGLVYPNYARLILGVVESDAGK